MVGPATIWGRILIGRAARGPINFLTIAAVLFVNVVVVCAAQSVVSRLDQARDNLLGSYFIIFMRTRALFIGAIGVEMILAELESIGAAALAAAKAQ